MSDFNSLLVQRLRKSMAGTYDVLGYVGSDAKGAHVLLGRDVSSNSLVGISVTDDPNDATQYSIDVQPTLGKTVTVEGSMCPECRTPLPELDAFCFHCGANLSGAVAAAGTPESEQVLRALSTATEGKYDVLGRLDREGSTGAVYFARDIGTDHIVALRLKRVDGADAANPEYVRKLTKIFDTEELQAKIAQRKAKQAEDERVASERAAAERIASERAIADRVAAERAAADRAAAAERAAIERATAERVATERAAAERASVELSAAERASIERAAAERAAAERAAYTPPPMYKPEFSLQEAAPVTPAPQPIHHSDYSSFTDPRLDAPDPKPNPVPVWKRTPVLAGAVVLLLAVLGYAAFSDSSPKPATVAAAGDTAKLVTTPAVTETATAAPTQSASTASIAPGSAAAANDAPTDSGTIRIAPEVPADARITLDGRSVRGRTLRVTARSHQLTVTAKGFDPYTEKISVAANATVRWSPKLVAVVAATTTNNAPASQPAQNNAPAASKKTCRDLMRAEDWSAAHDACLTEATSGNTFAAASMGRMYAQGLAVSKDGAQSISWYRKAADGGDHEAQSIVAYAFRNGTNGLKKDQTQAVQMFKLAAEGGDKAAQLEYGVALEKGEGIKKDQTAAREMYRKSSDQGIAMAAHRLARMLEKGDGGPKSEPEAIQYYEKAGNLGDGEAAFTVGKWYRDGRGVTQSPAQALTWFKKALDLGNKDAQGEIKKLQK